ncbi:DUF6894 family protein [Methylobacterium sp. J-070]|uniref:DUF6894 family protein n=1 Tax=Methylobacterium sp. J-070 TaxID=2836650 RepID=UPI00391D92E2
MPRFFIDTDDGRMTVTDEDGYELANVRAARDLAVRALCEMTQGDPGPADRRALSARVRSADGRTLYSVALTLTGEWWTAPHAA